MHTKVLDAIDGFNAKTFKRGHRLPQDRPRGAEGSAFGKANLEASQPKLFGHVGGGSWGVLDDLPGFTFIGEPKVIDVSAELGSGPASGHNLDAASR